CGTDAKTGLPISEWWRKGPGVRSYECDVFEGESASVDAVQQAWDAQGPFDGILGFSQGAILLAGLVAQ
ncbi:hypothetical protein SARC_16273, partial [Sphaeroforma arctica JP610]